MMFAQSLCGSGTALSLPSHRDMRVLEGLVLRNAKSAEPCLATHRIIVDSFAAEHGLSRHAVYVFASSLVARRAPEMVHNKIDLLLPPLALRKAATHNGRQPAGFSSFSSAFWSSEPRSTHRQDSCRSSFDDDLFEMEL